MFKAIICKHWSNGGDGTIELANEVVKLTDQELDKRRSEWSPPAPNYERGVLAKYAKLVSSASVGAVTS